MPILVTVKAVQALRLCTPSDLFHTQPLRYADNIPTDYSY